MPCVFLTDLLASCRAVLVMRIQVRLSLVMSPCLPEHNSKNRKGSCRDVTWRGLVLTCRLIRDWSYPLTFRICTRHVRVPDLVKFRSILLNFPVRDRYAYLSGTWKMKMAKPKVEGTPTVGSISKKGGLYRGDSLVQIHQLPVPGGKLLMGTTETFLVYRNIIFELVVCSHSWCDPFFETQNLSRTGGLEPA